MIIIPESPQLLYTMTVCTIAPLLFALSTAAGVRTYVGSGPCRPAAPRVHYGRATRRVSSNGCQQPRHNLRRCQMWVNALAQPRRSLASWDM